MQVVFDDANEAHIQPEQVEEEVDCLGFQCKVESVNLLKEQPQMTSMTQLGDNESLLPDTSGRTNISL